MAEDYNSSQSPYWCTKTLLAISLSPSSPFWQAPEEPYPSAFPVIYHLPTPSQILCSHPLSTHHFLLSSGQHCPWPIRASAAKYTKFAYSSAFGFSVPTGPYITQLAPDSTLVLSRDGGETWAFKGARERTTVGSASVCGQKVSTLESTWWPWKDGSVRIRTTLVPPGDGMPDWHFRVHRIHVVDGSRLGSEGITTVEGGFAIKRRFGESGVDEECCEHNRVLAADRFGALAVSGVGASGVVDLSSGVEGVARIMKPDANTNLMHARTWIPVLERNMRESAPEAVFVTAVFAAAHKLEEGGFSDKVDDWARLFGRHKVDVRFAEDELCVA